MLRSSANVWQKRYMNEEDVDETTGLMSGEVVTETYEDHDRSSRDRRLRRGRENENANAVSKQARVQTKRKKALIWSNMFYISFHNFWWTSACVQNESLKLHSNAN